MRQRAFIHNHAVWLFFISFLLGVFFHYLISDGVTAKEEVFAKKPMNDYFTEEFFAADKFRPSHKINVTFREDADFKYMDIEADEVYKDALKIDITDGLISIESDVKKQSETNESGSLFRTQSFYMNKSFSVPDEVDERKAEIIKRDNVVVVKFPKIKDYI